jgi:hypothetical protein
MASNGNLPYPMQFDPSQWSNKYSPYQGVALPFMGQTSGVPTDARGNPISSYATAAAAAAPPAMAPATSLNSNPLTQAASPSGLNSMGLNPAAYAMGQGGPSAMNPSGNAALFAANWGGFMPTTPAAAPAAAAAPAPQSQTPDMGQAYLQALANPGKVTTPGATVPQSAPPSNQSGVLQQFLQNWQNKGSPTTGAGNYNNAGFFNALQGQV